MSYKIPNLTHLIMSAAARARNVHLMYSNDLKDASENFADHQKPTGSPQTLPLTQHSLDSIKTHTLMSVTFPNTMTQPISWVGGATPPPHNHQPFTYR